MYVMSPFTSLLVLEDEKMYEQFKVDRGRKDHWAMYPAPPQIPVVTEWGNAAPPASAPPAGSQPTTSVTISRAKAAIRFMSIFS